ncbi:MAG: phosphonate metabolism transcriptional regulator PhnF [Nitrospirae bacterium]|nr:phosphonate metabolism transcriptional regulator PhnF [Nitrospirota bacterium]
MISRDGGVACYQQLSEILIKQIGKGVFKPSEQIPTEMELSKRYKLNRHTVRQAIERLENEGFVYKIKGKGTFVANTKISYKVSRKTRFTTSILDVGLSPDARLLDSYEISAGRELSRKLNIKSSDKVVVLEIVRFVNKIPFCHTTSFLNSDRFPDIQNHIKGSFSLYELLKKHYDVEATRTSSSFEVSMPENSYMDILQISPKIPLLVVKSIAKDQNGEFVEYCITKFRGDICSIAVDFNGEGR